MASRSLTSLAALGLVAIAGCGDAAGNRPAARVSTVAVDTQQRPTRVDALRADADVAAAAGDQMSARHFLDEALALEPRNQTLRDRLVQLGGTPPLLTDTILLAAESTGAGIPGPTKSASGALPPSVAEAAPPTANPPEPVSSAPATRAAAPSVVSVAAIPPAPNPPEPAATVPTPPAARSVAPTRVRVAAVRTERRRVTRPSTTNVAVGGEVAVAPRTQPTSSAAPAPSSPAASLPTVAERPSAAPETATSMGLSDLADARVAAPHATTVAYAPQPAKHKRTWPWTRAQRWLVAKGVGAGGGAGVVVGAIIGNVPGALLVGSLGGGALGFKKATKIGPADPYPDQKKVATWEAKHHKAEPVPTEVASGRQVAAGEERREAAPESPREPTREPSQP